MTVDQGRQSQIVGDRLSGIDGAGVMCGSFRANGGRVYSIVPAVHNIVMKRVLDVGRWRRNSIQSLRIGLVLGEKQFVGAVAI